MIFNSTMSATHLILALGRFGKESEDVPKELVRDSSSIDGEKSR